MCACTLYTFRMITVPLFENFQDILLGYLKEKPSSKHFQLHLRKGKVKTLKALQNAPVWSISEISILSSAPKPRFHYSFSSRLLPFSCVPGLVPTR